MPIDLVLAKALELLAGSQLMKDKLQRNEYVIRFLKQLGLDPDHPPADFEAVYSYALVEYGVGKPQVCQEIFRAREIRLALREAFDQNSGQLWLQAGERFLESSEIGDRVRAIDVDPKRELMLFARCFFEVVKRSRMPGDVLLSHQVSSVQQQIAQVIERLERLPTLDVLRTELERLSGTEEGLLPGASAQSCRAFALAQQMRGWFETLGYRFGSHEVWGADYFEWIIDIPVRWGRYDRVLVRGIDGEVGIKDVRSLSESVTAQKVDEGWVVTARRISQAARGELATAECKGLAAFTLDELLDQAADFGGYLDWLTAEIEARGIEARYVPIACTKEEVDPSTHQRLGISRYGADDGWTEGYIDRWVDDPTKEHLSILGEFGTGKTWLTLHYAAQALRAYREAQGKGMNRPRLPIVIPLRDYAKAVSVESLFSEFFFRKHKLPIPHYDAFLQLNRMGKLLLIFDGFDEMAARVDKQQMINNFWELAKVVVPGSKVILTCRTEHFPEAREGRALLNAELQASTKGLSGETPQFEVLELEKFEDEQIRRVLSLSASEATVAQVMGNPQLLDLARRPVMMELILEALPEIEAGKPVDMSRVYLYAVRRKMEQNIKAERTFTSMADKLYFLCELSWEMLSNDKMSINYREIPNRIRKLFGTAVQEEKDLDHWHYDMMGQTMLIRNADGDYTPAHRSLLEFFVAYKLAAMLGVIEKDFLVIAHQQSNCDSTDESQNYTWNEYFRRSGNYEKLISGGFDGDSQDNIYAALRATPLSKTVLDLIVPMLDLTIARKILLKLIQGTRGYLPAEAGYIVGNLINVLVGQQPRALEGVDLTDTVIQNVNFTNISLRRTNLTQAILEKVDFNRLLSAVYTLSYSYDGAILAVGDSSGRVQIWNASTGQILLLLDGHLAPVLSVVFSPDGERLASGSDDKTIKIWNVISGSLIQTLPDHSATVLSVAFSPDGQRLASGSADSTVKVWNATSGEVIRTLRHDDWVRSVIFSPDGKQIASGSDDCKIKLWDVTSGKQIRIFDKHSSSVFSVVFSPNGQQLASGSSDNTIRLWNVKSGDSNPPLCGHRDWVRSIMFSPNGKRLVSGSDDNTIMIWDRASGELLQTLKAHSNCIRSIVFSPDGQRLASGGSDNTVKFWNATSGEVVQSWSGHSDCVRSVIVSPDGQRLASGGDDKTIKVWNMAAPNDLPGIFSGHSATIWSVAFSPDGQYLASGSADKTVKVWSSSGDPLKTLDGHLAPVLAVAFSPDGQLLASGSADKTIKLWDVTSGDLLYTFKDHSNWIRSVAFTPDGQLLASGSADKTIKLWDVTSGDLLHTFEGHSNWVRSVTFTSDGQLLASGSDDNQVRIWQVDSRKFLRSFDAHSDWVLSVVFSPDGSIIASGSADNTIKLWDTFSGTHIRTLKGHSNWVRSVAFTPDGQHLASGSADETIRIWSVLSSQYLHVMENKLHSGLNVTGIRGLTEAQKQILKAYGAFEMS
jgi:WD40 repeat protein